MMKLIAKTLAVLMTAMVAPLTLAAVPAEAACQSPNRWFAVNPVNSANFAANSGCDGLWANYPASHTDRVRGQYYVNGTGWVPSSYQWKTVSSTQSPKIIGNTVVDRVLRGEGEDYAQNINVRY